ncbi:MAG: FUSC family protein [Stenotrophobium sp.]
MNSAWREVFTEEAQAWTFAFKTVIAMLLALWIAFRLGFDSPASAAVTVVIVSLQHSGLGLEKSFYRLLGTLIGAFATLLFLALFAQQRDLFMLALIMWIGLCVAGSRWLRNFQAYGFVLAGYTAYIIGFPAYEHADAAFEIAVDRVSVVALGILCGGGVNTVILPRSSTQGLVLAVRKSFADFAGFIEQAIARHVSRDFLRQSQQRFAQDIIALDAIRTASFFENSETRVRGRRLRRFISEFMMATTTLHAVHRLREDLAARGDAYILAALKPLDNAFLQALRTDRGETPGSAAAAAPVATRLAVFATDWEAHGAAVRARLADGAPAASRIELDSALALLHQLTVETRDYTETFASLDVPRSLRERTSARSLMSHADSLMALIAGLRAMLTLLAVSAFWILSGWADGFPAALLAAVACALFVNAPVPAQAAGQMMKGFMLGFAASFVCLSFVLPRLDGFLLLSAGLAPFLLAGTFLMARPATAGIGTGYLLMFVVALGIGDNMRFDVVELINGGLAQMLGLGAAIAAFALILPAGHPWRARRLRTMLARELVLTRSSKATGLRHRFESRVRDLMLQLATLYGTSEDEKKRDIVGGVLVLETGRALIALRELADRQALRSWAAQLDDCLNRIASGFADSGPAALQAAEASLATLLVRIDAGSMNGAEDDLIRARADLRVLQLAVAERIAFVNTAALAHDTPLVAPIHAA